MPSGQSHVVHSLTHTKWNCKYHIVFAPKYRGKVFYEEKRLAIRDIQRQLCEWKGVEIFEGEILYNNDRKENCVVKYDEEKAMFIVEYLESKDKFTLWESISNLYYSVGNINEDQELLENKLAD